VLQDRIYARRLISDFSFAATLPNHLAVQTTCILYTNLTQFGCKDETIGECIKQEQLESN